MRIGGKWIAPATRFRFWLMDLARENPDSSWNYQALFDNLLAKKHEDSQM